MIANSAKKRATYADLEAVPLHLVAEIIFGSLVTHPRPSTRHGRASTRLGTVLGGPFDLGQGGPGGWVFIDEPQLHLGEHIVVPDIAGWRQERWPQSPDIVGIATAPDWVCEVLSPSTETYDRGDKRLVYAEAGVRYLWLVDPRARILEAFVLSDKKWLLMTTVSGEADVGAPPFEAHRFALSLLWPNDPSPSEQA